MNDCSLCKDPLDPEGGAILFTDSRGVPFEVCGKCEGYIDMLHNSQDEAEIKTALDYIAGCAENVEYRDTYNALMGFVRSEESESELTEEEEKEGVVEGDSEVTDSAEVDEPIDTESEVASEPDCEDDKKKTGNYSFLIVVVVVVAVVVLAYALGVFPLR